MARHGPAGATPRRGPDLTGVTHASGPTPVDVCVVGAGQSGLSLGYHLRREARRTASEGTLSFVLLDDRDRPGGAWVDAWDTLSLFSPAAYSSLAGWPMPPWRHEGTPSARHVVDYLRDYETRYDLPVRRPVRVTGVSAPAGPHGRLLVRTDCGEAWSARVVVNATGTWSRPLWPAVPGIGSYAGRQLHTADYRSATGMSGRVLVVGGGNSAAQIAADLRLHSACEVTWGTRDDPRFLPDEIDGRALFETATRAIADRARGRANAGVASLGDIVAVPSVRQARDLGLRARPGLTRLTPAGATWADRTEEAFDTVLWCTGFRPALAHLRGLHLPREQGHPRTSTSQMGSPVRAATDQRLFFLGYGDWCGPASATLIGVNRAARDLSTAIVEQLVRSEP